MLSPQHKRLSLSKQCKILKISRSSYYYKGKRRDDELKIMRLIDEHYLQHPASGSRGIRKQLIKQGIKISRKRVQRLMRLMGIEAIYPKPKTSKSHPEHKVYPYLLRNLKIERPNQVWCSDITYIPMERGFMYLVAIMDWYSRKILSWRVSNTLDTDFCLDALEEAISRYGCPEMFNTDQGSQFTSNNFTAMLNDHQIAISMDGKGRCRDNIFIERFWWTLKYHYVYLHAFESGSDLRSGLKNWISYYNHDRCHQSLDDKTPDEAYYDLSYPAVA